VSPNGQFQLRMQTDGNLVLAGPGNSLVWTTYTDGNPGAYAAMQGDGNFVIYSAAGKALWATHQSGGRDGTVRAAVLQDDGNFVLLTRDNQIVWQSRSMLSAGVVLHSGQCLVSPNGKMLLAMQTDGNLVLYPSEGSFLWAAYGTPGAYAAMQGDGNFVLYDASGKALWSTKTDGKGAANAVLQDDGNFVLYTRNNQTVWARPQNKPAQQNNMPTRVAMLSIYLVDARFGTKYTSGTAFTTQKTINVYPQIFPTNAANQTLKWTSDDPNVATVDQNGRVTLNLAMQADGSRVTIFAETTDGSRLKDFVFLKVYRHPGARFVPDPTGDGGGVIVTVPYLA